MLTFNPETHEYKEDGLTIPSVTQILKESGLINFDYLDPGLLAMKADLGTKVHQTTEYEDMGTLDIGSLDPLLEGYLEGWIKFKADFNFIPLEIELQLSHSLYRYAGTIDRTGLVGKDLILLDIKSGTRTRTHSLQTMGYRLLYDQNKKPKEQIKKRLCIYLNEFGQYKVEENKDDITDKSVFLSALTICNYLRKNK